MGTNHGTRRTIRNCIVERSPTITRRFRSQNLVSRGGHGIFFETRYRYPKNWLVRYEFDTGTPGTGTSSTAIPEVRVFVRYGLNTVQGTSVKDSIRNQNGTHTPVNSVHPPQYTPGTGKPSTTIPGGLVFFRYDLGTGVSVFSGVIWTYSDVISWHLCLCNCFFLNHIEYHTKNTFECAGAVVSRVKQISYGQRRSKKYPNLRLTKYAEVNSSNCMFGSARNKLYRGCLVGKYPTKPTWCDRRLFTTGTHHFDKFGTLSIPVSEASVTSVRPPKYTPVPVYRRQYRVYRYFVRYSLVTGTRHFGEFGIFSIPVANTAVTSVLFSPDTWVSAVLL